MVFQYLFFSNTISPQLLPLCLFFEHWGAKNGHLQKVRPVFGLSVPFAAGQYFKLASGPEM